MYRTDVRDDISFINSDSAPLAGYFASIGNTRREGVELSAQAHLDGVDGRYTGRQWLRGDEANETQALDGYFTADLRLGWEREQWGSPW
ncbi:MAG: hypothetical protein ACREMW_06995 [Gemmatimonadales bacterium]